MERFALLMFVAAFLLYFFGFAPGYVVVLSLAGFFLTPRHHR